MRTEINKFQRTFTITHEPGAFINGYTYDGEVFYIEVPERQRRKGIAKQLLIEAEKTVDTEKLIFTSPISKEGEQMIEWYKERK